MHSFGFKLIVFAAGFYIAIRVFQAFILLNKLKIYSNKL